MAALVSWIPAQMFNDSFGWFASLDNVVYVNQNHIGICGLTS